MKKTIALILALTLLVALPLFAGCNKLDKDAPRIIRIRNTLALGEMEISEALIPEMTENMEIISEPYSLPFDENGNLF